MPPALRDQAREAAGDGCPQVLRAPEHPGGLHGPEVHRQRPECAHERVATNPGAV